MKDSLYVTVKPLPLAKMTVSPDNCAGTNVSFTDNSVPGNGKTITDWYWDFGGGSFDVKQNPTTKYLVTGTYSVLLTVTDNDGCVDTATTVLNVWPSPTVNFSVSSACQGDTARFTNSSVVSGGTILQSIWDFGDGSPLTAGNSLSHVYPNSSSSYTVKLIVTSNKNCVSSGQKSITMYPNPTPSFSSSSVCIYNSMKFTNQSTGNYSYWDFGDTTTSTLSNPSHKYQYPGSYNVKLVTSSSYGCKDSIIKRFDVYDRPQYDFTAYDTAGCPTFCARFKSKILTGSDSISSFLWLLSTGDIAFGDSVVYCFTSGGVYSPSLIATTKFGCKDTLSKANYINVYSQPNADFILNPDIISTFDPDVNIYDNSSSDVIKWWWDFGDGSVDSTSAGPFKHTYLNIVDQTVKLKVENSLGCLDSTEKYIGSRPESSIFIPNAFTPNDDGLNNNFRPYVSGIYDGGKFEMI